MSPEWCNAPTEEALVCIIITSAISSNQNALFAPCDHMLYVHDASHSVYIALLAHGSPMLPTHLKEDRRYGCEVVGVDQSQHVRKMTLTRTNKKYPEIAK